MGNRAVAQLLLRQPVPAPPAAAAGTAPGAAPGDDKELLEREEKAMQTLDGLKGGSAGTFLYGSPNSPDYQPPEKPPSANLTLGGVVARPTTDTDKRRSFDSEVAAQAFATFSKGPAGAAVLKSDSFWFVAALTAASDSELSQPHVYRFTAGPSVACVIGVDGFVFTSRDYTPDTGRAGQVSRAEKELASPASAEELRKLAGMRPEGPDAGKAAPAAGTKIPAGQEEAFIAAYLRSRALEALEQNRKQADGLAKDFAPGKDGKLGKEASALISKSRALGGIYQQLEADEAKVGEMALTIHEKHLEGRWNNITVKGRTQKYHAWIDEINGQLATIASGKESTLALSPLLASMVRHDATPKTAGGWAEKLGWERSNVRKLALSHPLIWGVSKLADLASDSAQGEKWADSELSKKGSEESDKKVAEQFRTKLDGIQKAISKTYGKVTGGDIGYLLGMGGLRSRVSGDIGRMGAENKAVKDKWKEMCDHHDMVEDLVDIGGTVVQIAALFLPGGQFISAAIGMGMQMRTMEKHMEQWDAAHAAVDPTKALVDQQELAQKLLFDTLNIAIQAVDLATSFNSVLGDLEAGRVPKDAKAGSEATDPAGKHVGDKDLPAPPPKVGAAPATGSGAGMSEGFAKRLTELGIPGGNPYAGVNPSAVHTACGKDWNKVKAMLLKGGENEADKMAGEYVMHQMTAYRASATKSRLDTICNRLTKETGVVHEAEAVGSTALTSDLDYSIKGPRASQAVTEFNSEFRQAFGVESGVAFDSNVYTRSAHLDFPLTAKPGDAKIPLDAKGLEEWNSFKGKSLGAASEAEKGRLAKVIEQAEKEFPDDLRARLRSVDNFRQQSASHVRAYENAMSHGAEGPAMWKQYCEGQLAGVSGAQRAMVQAELEQAAAQSLRAEGEVLEQLRKQYPKENWTPERLREMAHSKDPAELDKFMTARNRLYETKLKSMDQLKAAYEKAGSEAERLQIAAQINQMQTESLYFASEAYQTQGSILSVVQNAQKAGGDVASPHYGQLVSNQCRAAFNEQVGNAMAYGGGWPEVVKAGKYVNRADGALKAHPIGVSALTADVEAAIGELDKLKALAQDAPELKNWAGRHYPAAPDVKNALAQHRAKMSAAETKMMGQMNRNVAAMLEPGVWEAIAKNPDRLNQVLKALAVVARQTQED
jgi:hypothetical protein